MKKRLLALILCLVMVIGLVPTAFAAETDEDNMRIRFAANVNENVEDGVHGPIYWTTAKQGDFAEASDLTGIPRPTKDGYTFLGWSTVYSEPLNGDALKIVSFDGKSYLYPEQNVLTLYAVWQENTPAEPEYYTIRLRANDDAITSTYIDISVKVGESTTLPTQPFKRSGYTLVGWSSRQNATSSSTDFKRDGATVSYITAQEGDVITLYAVWEEKSEPQGPYSLTYHETENPRSATKTYTSSDSTYKLADYEVLGWTLPEGKTLKYWVDSFDNVYTKGTTLTLKNHGLELYPVFEDAETPAKEYTVTFYCWYHNKTNEKQKFARDTKIVIDPNGGRFWYDGSYTKDTETFYLTSDYKIADAERRGYTFYGWEATENARTNTVTFTARWSKYSPDYPDYRDYSVYYYDYDDGKYEYAYFDYNDTLIFDANGGSAKLNGTKFTGTKTVSVAQNYTLSDAERAGYTFYGWDLVEATGSKYYFTAMWAKKTGTVPYMLNGTDHFAYIKGYPDGTIRPEATITRAEVATIFYRLLTDSVRQSYGTSYNTFKDVASSAWYNTAVSTMANLGIITGDASGYFRPSDPITRAELAAMIARCDGGYYTGSGYYFSDTKGHWAADYIARAYDLGWINGYGDTYAPDRKITRAETMAVLNRVLDRNPQYTSDLLSGMRTFSDNLKTSAWYYLDVQEATNSHTYTRKTSGYEYWNKLIADPSWY